MKIASIPKTKYEADCSKASSLNSLNNPVGSVTKDSVSFGGVPDGFKTASTGTFRFIEKAGFLVEFLILDTFSMILPRIAVGLNRDKDKTGKWNYRAGAEEAGREIMSGPTMQILPLAMLTGVCALKPASHMDRSTLNTLTSNMKVILEKSTSLTEKSKLDRALAEEIFNNAYKGKKVSEQLKQQFIDLLSNSPNHKKKLFNNEVYKNNESGFLELVSEINNKLSKGSASLSPEKLDLLNIEEVIEKGIKKQKKSPVSICAKDLYQDFGNYSRDVIDKLSKSSFAGSVPDKAKGLLESIKNSRLKLKMATAVSAFFAVGGLLLYLPKLYQRGKVSPAEESAKRAIGETAKVNGGANEN